MRFLGPNQKNEEVTQHSYVGDIAQVNLDRTKLANQLNNFGCK